MKTILVTCPTRGQVHYQVAQALQRYATTYVWGPRGIAEARNHCRQLCLGDLEAQILVMVDDDVVPHPEAFELGMQPMLRGEVDAIVFPCPLWRQGKLLPNLYDVQGAYDEINVPELSFRLRMDDADEDNLLDIDAGGFGCVAISKRALTETGPFDLLRDDAGQAVMGEDIDYCLRMKRLGFTVKASATFLCEHFMELPGTAVADSFVTMVEEARL